MTQCAMRALVEVLAQLACAAGGKLAENPQLAKGKLERADDLGQEAAQDGAQRPLDVGAVRALRRRTERDHLAVGAPGGYLFLPGCPPETGGWVSIRSRAERTLARRWAVTWRYRAVVRRLV